MKPHRVLYITPWSDLYGSSRYLYELVTRLDKKQYFPFVVLQDQGPLFDHLGEAGIQRTLTSLSILNKKNSVHEVVSFFSHFAPGIVLISRMIKRFRIDLVHTNTCHILAGAFAAKIMRIPHIWHIHERDISPFFLRRVLAGFVLGFSERVITVSEENKKQFFGALHQPKRIDVICGGVDLSVFDGAARGQRVKDEFALSPDMKIVGMVGRITPWKGQATFLEAAAKVIEDRPQTTFFVVGNPDVQVHEAYKRDLLAYVKTRNMKKNVIFTGFREDVSELLAVFDILVLPSIEAEPFGLVLVEAMAMSKPVIATSIGGPLEIVEQGRTGLLVPPRDPAKLAEAISTLLNDDRLRVKMGENGRRRVEEMFTWDRTVERIEARYRDVLRWKCQG